MRNTLADLVQNHARIRCLLFIKKSLVGASNEDAGLLLAEDVEIACRSRNFRTWVASKELSLAPVEIGELKERLDKEFSPCEFSLYSSHVMDSIVGKKFAEEIVRDLDAVEIAWAEALEVIERLKLTRLQSLVQAVDIILGLQGPYGEIRAFSNPVFPGFVAFSVNNPSLVIAEQAVHESTHCVLASMIALRPELSELQDSRVGVLSPFTDSVRTIERVSHGILTYMAVRELWRAVSLDPCGEELLPASDRVNFKQITAQRLALLESRIRLAVTALQHAAGNRVCAVLSSIAEELLGVSLDSLVDCLSERKRLLSASGYTKDVVELGAVERAEIKLAEIGEKVSRISVPLWQSGAVGFTLLRTLSVSASGRAVRSVFDERLGGFSNIANDFSDVVDADFDSEIYLYLHPDSELVRRAALLDLDDQAGELLGIPPCCRAWFSSNWDDCVRHGGDLFARMVRGQSIDGTVFVAKECDLSSLYRGGGFCWHFPCSPRCDATIKIVVSRRRILEAVDRKLVMQLDEASRDCITILSDGRYVEGAVPGPGSLVVVFE